MVTEVLSDPGAYASRVEEGVPLRSLSGWYAAPFVDPLMGKNGSDVVILTQPDQIDAVYETADHTRSLDPTFNGSLVAKGMMRYVGLLKPVTITDNTDHRRGRRELARGFNTDHMRTVVRDAAEKHLQTQLQDVDPDEIINLRGPMTSYVADVVTQVVGLSPRAARTLGRNAEAFGDMTWDTQKHASGVVNLGQTALQSAIATMRHGSSPDSMIATMIDKGVRRDRVITHALTAASGGMATRDTLTNLVELIHYHEEDGAEAWQALGDPEQSMQVVESRLPDASSLVAWVVRGGEPVTLGGIDFKKGQTFLTVTGSGNQDQERALEDKYPFGKGPHTCIGSHLGRLVIATGAEILATTFPNMTRGSDAAPKGRANAAFRWPEALPVKLGAKA